MMSVGPFKLLVVVFVISIVCIDKCIANYPLNMTCSPPVSQGGKGYCGPSYCDTSVSTLPACIFSSLTYNFPSIMSKLNSKTCTQSTDPRCTSAALAVLVYGNGIKAAYCNDAFLVIQSDETTGFDSYLGSIKFPPSSTSSNGTTCVTRYVNNAFGTIKIPLYPTMLNTSDPLINNVNTNAFPNGPSGTLDAAYMSTTVKGTGATYGLPSRGSFFSAIN
jgi:hypothetical protein